MVMSLSAKHFDIVIVGAGPAGSTCALALATSGLKVAVVEKHRFPRDKVCGDAVAAYVPDVLGTINPDYKQALGRFTERVDVDTCRVVAPNGKHIDIKYQKSGFIAKRIEWDNFLFDLATNGSPHTFFSGDSIIDIARANGLWQLTTAGGEAISCKLLIGCDGAHSLVARHAGIGLDHNHHAGAVRGYFTNVKSVPKATFELHFLKDYLPGYFWIFPLKENLSNVGLGILSSEISARKISLRDSLKQIVSSVPSVGERFIDAELVGKIEGFGLPLGSRKVTMSGDGFMLCGDAASLIDPLSGEGIGQAIVSGRYAGWHAIKCFERDTFSAAFMKEYEDLVYKKFWKRHQLNHSIQKMIAGRAWLFNAIFNVAVNNRVARHALIKAFS
jgi:menaquinone-9 beta-reductase